MIFSSIEIVYKIENIVLLKHQKKQNRFKTDYSEKKTEKNM